MFHNATFVPIPDCPWPIFHLQLDSVIHLFYTPGYVVATSSIAAQQLYVQLSNGQANTFHARTLRKYAHQSTLTWAEITTTTPFRPLSLTIYPTMRCNLSCMYCFSGEKNDADIDIRLVKEWAVQIAKNCYDQQKLFTFAVQGGGEPLLCETLPDLLSCVCEICTAQKIPLFSYLSTNGCVSAQKMQWAALNFDHISLSCDGPLEIQNAQRPFADGSPTAAAIESSAQILCEIKGALTVRATVSADSVHRMPESTAYLVDTLKAKTIRFEPQFCATENTILRAKPLQEAQSFAENFCAVRKKYRTHHTDIVYSGVRCAEIHGPFCNPLRDTILITTDGTISACLKCTHEETVHNRKLDLADNEEKINHLKANIALSFKQTCTNCFNRFHCTRGCPQACWIENGTQLRIDPLRCEINRKIALDEIVENATHYLLPHITQSGIAGFRFQPSSLTTDG